MEGTALLEAIDSTNLATQEESLTPDRPNTPENPPTQIIKNDSNQTDNCNLDDSAIDKNDSVNNQLKPTFKNIQQAKKRLQAFSVQKLNQLPTSPLAKKAKLDEKIIEDTAKKLPKKYKDPNEKAKAVIEEIEEIKRNEQAYLESVRASLDKEHFKKVEKKPRSIRKRSPSLEKLKKSNDNNSVNKEKRRYPKNWKEFAELKLDFDEFKREFDNTPTKGHNDLTKQLLFESPSLPIVQTRMKLLNREERVIPFQYVRYTRSKPVISFNCNFNKMKEKYLNKKTVFQTIPKEIAANIEKLYTNSLKFKTDYCIKMRNWYPKSWKDYNNECKLLENSVGLSFLQSYTEDEETEATSTHHNDDNQEKLKNFDSNDDDKEIVKKKKKNSDKKKKKKKSDEKKKKQNKSKKKKRAKEKKHKHKSDDDDDADKDKNKDEDNQNKHKDDMISMKMEDSDNKTDEKSGIIENLRETNDNNTEIEIKIDNIETQQQQQQQEPEEADDEKRAKTPDTEEYHSLWESEDDLTVTKPTRPSIKLNRSWESDEELFERSGNNHNNNTNNSNNDNNSNKKCDYNNLEIPLDLTNIIITRKPITIDNNNDKNNGNNSNNEVLKPVVNLNLDLDIINKDNDVNLENQYEEFIKAVSTDSSSLNQQQQPQQQDDNKKESDDDSSSSDTSSSSSSTSSSSSSSSDSSTNNITKKKKKTKYKLKKTKRKRNKITNIFNEFDIPVPSDLPDVGGNHNNTAVLPLPVPSPDQPLLLSSSSSLTIATTGNNNKDVIDLNKPFVFPTITIQSKKSLIDHSKLKLNDDSDSCDFTEKFLKKSNDDDDDNNDDDVPDEISIKTPTESQDNNANKKRVNDKIKDKKYNNRDRKYKNSSKKPLRRRYSSPLLRRCSPKRRHSPVSSLPQSQRRRSPKRRSLSPRRRSVSPRNYRRLRSPSPRRKHSLSPQQQSRKRALSPINSPLDGFKKSVADSTISDDMLPQPSIDDYSQSPISTYNNITTIDSSSVNNNNNNNHNNSPRRISLDDRINQVLGLEKHEHHKQMNIDYQDYNNYYDQQYYGQYPQNIGYSNYNLTPIPQQSIINTPQSQSVNTPTKVVQVGNILQVVPTEDVHHLLENQLPETTGQKIVQVGNMLQIVPAVIQPVVDNLTTTTTTPPVAAITPTPTVIATPIINHIEDNQQIDENRMKQKSLERKAEREKRRLERMKRRKDKEKKRKERERRRQLKLKLKTENMIKKALQLEADSLFDEDDDGDSVQWPPIQVVVSTSSDTPNKGILLSGGFSRIDGKKSVQFADGIRPGEGTSPSGGEELSSPPPNKPKRHKKIKLPKKMKKKKIKVKVKRIKQQQQLQQQQENDDDGGGGGGDGDDDEEFENLPPPSPPPGSPPPHVFPSRVKEPTFNNINPYIVANSGYVTPYARQPIPPPLPQMVMNRAPYMSGSFHPVPDVHHSSFPGANHGIHH